MVTYKILGGRSFEARTKQVSDVHCDVPIRGLWSMYVHPPPLQIQMLWTACIRAQLAADNPQSCCPQPSTLSPHFSRAIASPLPMLHSTKIILDESPYSCPSLWSRAPQTGNDPMPVSTTGHVGRARILLLLSYPVASCKYRELAVRLSSVNRTTLRG